MIFVNIANLNGISVRSSRSPCLGVDDVSRNRRRLKVYLSVVLGIVIANAVAYRSVGYPGGDTALARSLLFSTKDIHMRSVAKKIAEFKDIFYVGALAFNEDGSQLAINFMVGDDGVHLWAWQEPSRIIKTLVKPGGAGDGSALAYSPDGKLLAVRHGITSDGRVIRVWNAHTGEVVRDLTEQEGQGVAGGIAFTPDGKWLMLTISRGMRQPGDQLFVYRTDTWELVRAVRTMPFQPKLISVSPDGKLLALGGETTQPWGVPWKPKILLLDLANWQVVRTIDAPFLGDVPIATMVWSPDARHIAVGCNPGDQSPDPDVIKIVDIANGKPVAGVPAKNGTVTGLTYSPDGRYLIAGSVDDSVRIMDSRDLTVMQKIPGDLRSLAVSRDSRYLAISAFPKISVWELYHQSNEIHGSAE